MTMINIRHLRAFAAVAEHRHFTKAAEAIFVSQPALSALIQQLETELGATLLHRSTRNVELTAIGREFYAIVTKLLASFEDALAHVSDYSNFRRGKVTLAILPSLAASILPPLLAGFTQAHPMIAINIVDVHGEAIMDAVRSKTADLALTHAHPQTDMNAVSVMRDRLVLIGAPRSATPKGKSIRWNALKDEPLIAMAPGTTIRALTDSAALTSKTSLNIVLEAQSIPTAIALAEAGLGSAILPSTQIAGHALTELPQFDLTQPTIEREISLLHLSPRALSPAAEALFNHLQEGLIKSGT